MSEKNQLLELAPAPSDVISIVHRLVDSRSPKNDSQQEALFAQLGFISRNSQDNPDEQSALRINPLDVGLGSTVLGTWGTYGKDFLDVTLHLYTSTKPESAKTRQGFLQIKNALSNLYGPARHPWEDEQQPPCIWEWNGWTITMHLFNARDSAVMLTVEDTNLAQRIDADEATH
ncbi:hypothetical protein ACTXL8_17935 [Glutamicibacter arilaitensis]|uniref:hypothetical protein n=1 Tax=Glutamicibacter arilaitensis TaxID=256701 RepID=UPI003FCFA983